MCIRDSALGLRRLGGSGRLDRCGAAEVLAERKHGAGDLGLAHDRQRRPAFGEMRHLGIGMGAGDERQGRILGAGLLADLAGFEAAGDGDEEADSPADGGGGEHLRVGGIADQKLGAVALGRLDRVGIVLDDQELGTLREQAGAEQAADAAVADDDDVVGQAGRSDVCLLYTSRCV